MDLLEQTLTIYLRGLFIAGLILAVPFVVALIIDTIKLTKGDNN